jgi:transposase
MGGVVLAGLERHRRYSVEQKIAIVGESYQPGVLMRDVMARYDLASSVIYAWRKQAREGRLGGGMFAPVAIVDQQDSSRGVRDIKPEGLPHGEAEPTPDEQVQQSDGAVMVVALRDGVRILVNNGVDEGALGKVLRALALVTGR